MGMLFWFQVSCDRGINGFEDNFQQLTAFSKTFMRQVLDVDI